MKRFYKILSFIAVVALTAAIISPSAFAKEFAPLIDTNNIGVNTQYKYDEVDPSWLRQLTIKEDMLSTSGIINEEILYPVCAYPYTTDARHFKAEVEEYIKLYTIDENSQRAAYLYLLEQVGALSIIANPETSDKSKADWLREQGIVITKEDEQDADKVLMISALYALMQNDFYYVIKGERLTIPEGTTLEEATVLYLMGLSGDSNELTKFVLKYFGKATVGNLDDYIYYTSLMSLYTQGYVSPFEIPTLTRDEVYKRVAIMTIRTAGIAIDSETATTEEIRHKYLAAMLGSQYAITVEPDAFKRALDKGTAPYYILQRMAYEDANVTISQTKYTYEECFKLVLQKTQRFDLENEFYSDIFEYDIYLDNIRSNISINANPINKSGVTIAINDVDVTGGSYAVVELAGKAKETITIVTRYKSGKTTAASTYKINVHQGSTVAPDSDLTGIIQNLGNLGNNVEGTENSNGGLQAPALTDALGKLNNAANPLLNSVLTLNEKGQLVDQYGNIVSDSTYETLSPGYEYMLNDDGIITVVLTDQTTTEPTTADDGKLSDEDVRTIIIIVSIVCMVLLIAAIIVVAVISKKRQNVTPEEKMRARKAKERRKKEKQERR